MFDIKIETYYHDQLTSAFCDAHKAGKKGEDAGYLGEDSDGQEVFYFSKENIPSDLSNFLSSELEQNGELEIGEREVDTSYEDEEISEPGNTYNVNIHY